MASNKYIYAVGRRKTAIARVRFYAGTSETNQEITVNNKKIEEYFSEPDALVARSAIDLLSKDLDGYFTVKVLGGGKHSQAGAIRHGISRILLLLDADSKPLLKSKGYLTRDARMKERKKPGLRRARRAPQWSKR